MIHWKFTISPIAFDKIVGEQNFISYAVIEAKEKNIDNLRWQIIFKMNKKSILI